MMRRKLQLAAGPLLPAFLLVAVTSSAQVLFWDEDSEDPEVYDEDAEGLLYSYIEAYCVNDQPRARYMNWDHNHDGSEVYPYPPYTMTADWDYSTYGPGYAEIRLLDDGNETGVKAHAYLPALPPFPYCPT